MLEKWRAAAADEVNSTTPPTIPAAGSDGYPQDKDVGVKGTPIQAWWYHMIQGSLAAVVTGLGGAFGANTTALWAALAPRLSGILSHATDTGVVTTTHTRTVVGATSSQASAAGANVCGGNLNTASGSYSTIHGGVSSIASGDYSHISGGGFGVASGTSSSITGSLNVELKTSHALGGGYSLAPVITPSGANQNLSWLLKSDGGHGHLAGNVLVGGDVDAGTGEKCRITGSDGDVHTEGDVRVGGEATAGTGATVTIAGATGNIDADGALTVGEITALPLTYDSGTAAYSGVATDWTVSVSGKHGKITITNANNKAYANGDTLTLAVTLGGATSAAGFMFVQESYTDAKVKLVQTQASGTLNAFTASFQNIGTGAIIGDAWTCVLRFIVIEEG